MEIGRGVQGAGRREHAMSSRMKRNRRKTRAEHWTKMLRLTMEEPAWQALSTTAQALYPWLKFEWHGPKANNNGKIRLSLRQAAEKMGIKNLDTVGRAFHDLQAKGFIVQTEPAQLGFEGAACGPAYEITELRSPAHDRERKLYRDWRPGLDFLVPKANANNPSGRNGRRRVGNVVTLKPKQ